MEKELKQNKKETLEEAAEKTADNFEEPNFKAGVIYGVIEGAKWQQEKSYSEKESIQKIIDYVDFQFNTNGELNSEIKKWFEQFSKLKNG